ncbi:MAG: dienelactone hydrolase family protein [Deltaproteobacteria bacterium]|nr:dienelactone hydrolase family protein [Deltaproteobacteria bacterium]
MKAVVADEKLVHIKAGGVRLEGALAVPAGARGIALFAHGSGSSRKSPRNNFVAQVLQKAGLATLLMDLLTREEDLDYERRFDIDLLADRLRDATVWVEKEGETSGLKIGYFGASTGAAAAIKAAVEEGASIGAIVSRGGRPDLAQDSLAALKAPILLIVGGRDDIVVELNRKAYSMIGCEKELVIVPGATHLFEEPGTLEEAANHAALWFKEHIGR